MDFDEVLVGDFKSLADGQSDFLRAFLAVEHVTNVSLTVLDEYKYNLRN